MKNKILISLVVILTGMLVSIGIYLYQKSADKGMLNFECFSEFTFMLGENESLPSESAILRYHAKPDGTGLYSVDGIFETDKEKYRIARTIHFTYKPYGNDTYHFTITRVEKNQRDNIPEALYSNYLSDWVGVTRVSRITRLGRDAYVLGTATTPMLICTRFR